MKYKNFVFALVIYVSYLLVTGCHKNTGCHWAAEPPYFFFQIKKNGIILNDSILDGLKISYTSGNGEKYISDLSIATDSSGILGSRQIGTFQNQDFFIKYLNNSDIDTLTVQNLMPSPATNCEYKIEQVKFNNFVIISDTTVDNYYPLYVFLKQ
jgi:hypothetical protein